MTDIQKEIRDSIRGISYDIQNATSPEENMQRASAIKLLVEAYEITTIFGKEH